MNAFAYRWLWARGMALVLAARLALRVDAAGALRRAMRHAEVGRDPATIDEWRDVSLVALAAATAGRWVVDQRRPCLPIAMAAQRLLARRGFRAVLHLGVGRRGHVLEAHAWVECGGRVVVGRSDRPLTALRAAAPDQRGA